MTVFPEPSLDVDSLGVIAEARARTAETLDLASRHLDPSLVEVLEILGFDREYVSASGAYLYDADGREYLDFHSGEGFASLGHNHPDVREVLRAALAADLVDGVQLHYSPLAGMLAQELSRRLPAGLDAVFFASSGAEAVDSAMKFARAATRRARLLSCDDSFHGVTLGPLSLVGDDFFKEGFGPLLPGCERVPFGDLERLEAALRARDVAAFIVEPIQGRKVTPAAARLPRARSGALPALRHAVRCRRDPDRSGTHRQLVRARALRARAGRRACRQGAERRLHAGCGDGHDAEDLPGGGRDARPLLRAPVDVRPQPPIDGGWARHAADHRTRRSARARRRA